MRALFRPQTDEPLSNIHRLADLSLDQATHEVRRGEISINLGQRIRHPKYMLRNRGRFYPQQIEQNAWSYDYRRQQRRRRPHPLSAQKIDDGPKLIHTVRGAGYVLKEEA